MLLVAREKEVGANECKSQHEREREEEGGREGEEFKGERGRGGWRHFTLLQVH